MIKHKRLTSKNGLTIPKDLRLDAGFHPGMAVTMECQSDGSILIQKSSPICRFCGSPEAVSFQGVDICKSCTEELWKAVKGNG